MGHSASMIPQWVSDFTHWFVLKPQVWHHGRQHLGYLEQEPYLDDSIELIYRGDILLLGYTWHLTHNLLYRIFYSKWNNNLQNQHHAVCKI